MVLCTIVASSHPSLFASFTPKHFLPLKLKKRDNNVVILQILPCGLGSPGLRGKVCQASTVLAVFSAAKGTRLGNIDGGRISSSGLGSEGLEKVLDGSRGKVLVVVVVNLDHRGVDTGTEAFDLEDGEETVGGGLTLLNAELLLDGLDDNIGAAASKLARGLFMPLLVQIVFLGCDNLQ